LSLKLHKLAIQVADITDFGTASGVTKILAGTSVSISPASGIGAVTVSAILDHKVLVDGADTTADFLNLKIVVAPGLTKTVQNPGGNETVQIALLNPPPSPPFIITAPSAASNNIIQSTADTTELTIQALAGQVTSIFLLLNSGGGSLWNWFPNGNLTVSNAQILINRTIGQKGIVLEGLSDLSDRFEIFPDPMVRWGSGGAGGVDLQLDRAAAGVFRITKTPSSPANTLAQLGLLGNEASAAERRIRENASRIEITTTTPTVLVQLSPLTSLGSAAVNATGSAVGTSVQIPHADHVHQLANPITGAINLLFQLGNSLGTAPGITFEDLNSGIVTDNFGGGAIAAKFSATQFKGGTFNIYIRPDRPGIVWDADSVQLTGVGLANLVTVNINNTAQGFKVFDFDYSGTTLGTAGSIGFGDDGVLFGGPTATTNMKFACAAGSTIDAVQFTGGGRWPKTRFGGTVTNPTFTIEANGSLAVGIVTKTAAYTATNTDTIVLADATAAAFTVTLPTSANGFNSPVGQILHIKKKDVSANAVTIAAQGADTIQGAANISLAAQYNSRTLWTDGSGTWYVLAST